MLLTLSTTAVAGGQKHRHHPVATATKKVSTPAAKATAADSSKEAMATTQLLLTQRPFILKTESKSW